jgi:hypothetical protein
MSKIEVDAVLLIGRPVQLKQQLVLLQLMEKVTL